MRKRPAGLTASVSRSSTVGSPDVAMPTLCPRIGPSRASVYRGSRAHQSKAGAMTSVRRSLAGAGAALGAVAALTAIMAPFRSHMSIATPALVLVIPVVIGVMVGGFVSGAVAAGAGFFVYDLIFIPPYGTLEVGAA